MEHNKKLDDFMDFEFSLSFCEDQDIMNTSNDSVTILENFNINSVGMTDNGSNSKDNVEQDLLKMEQHNNSDSTYCESPNANSQNNLMISENNNEDAFCETTQVTDECSHISPSQNALVDINYNKHLHSKIKENNILLANSTENITDKSLMNRVTNYFGVEDTKNLTKHNAHNTQNSSVNANVGNSNSAEYVSFFIEPSQNNKNEFNIIKNKTVPNAAPTNVDVNENIYMSFDDHFDYSQNNNNLVITTIIEDCSQISSYENNFNSNEIHSAEINKNMNVNEKVVINNEANVFDINMTEPLSYANNILNATSLTEINKSIHTNNKRLDNNDVFDINMKYITAINKNTKVNDQVMNDNETDVFDVNMTQSTMNISIQVNTESTQNAENKRTVRMLHDTKYSVDFKELEEFKKVKNYLNKKEKIESLGSRRRYRIEKLEVSQNSININESAQCLLKFITTCALVPHNEHITNQMSIELGKLIDKLIEEDQYPSFLEKLLKSIDDLFKYVYEGNNCEENILIKKEEAINRLYLLNRSSHIIKFSIQQITKILQETLENIKLDDFEIRYTDKAENLAHIFNILEVLLNDYLKIRNKSSQNSTQMSQDEGGLKKSALTQVWREKWNLSKSQVCAGSTQNDDFLTECREVLNKTTVEAMEGYCLVAFAALQCYNLLQN